jgi:hypothetical protein
VSRHWQRALGSILAAVALATALDAAAATITEKARLRQQPSKDSALVGWVDTGAVVSIDGERNGWYLIHTPDGQTGYVWQDHLRFDPSEHGPGAVIVPATPPPPPAPAAPTPTTLGEETHPAAPPEPAELSVTSELEQLHHEVGRLAAAQEDMARRLKRSEQGITAGANDGTAGAAALFLAVGALMGAGVMSLLQRRRDRRPRLRL